MSEFIKVWWANLNRILLLLRVKGLRFTWNRIHFNLFYYSKNPLIVKLLPLLVKYPPYIELEVTSRCAFRCVMCEHTYWDEPDVDISYEEFREVVDEFPGLKWIGLFGIGEPFLNRDYMKMIRYLKEQDVYIEIYDTFYYTDNALAKELVELEVDRMFVSLDAATKETYEAIRIGSNFDIVVENVRNFVKVKNEAGSIFPDFLFHFVMMENNVHEMPAYVDLVHSICGDQGIIQFSDLLHEFDEIKHLAVDVPPEIVEATKKRAEELGVSIAWNWNTEQEKPPIQMCTAWIMPYIFVSGHVIPCCVGNEANQRELQKKLSLGNVNEKSFKEIWDSPEYREFRAMIRRGETPPQCRDCGVFAVDKGDKE